MWNVLQQGLDTPKYVGGLAGPVGWMRAAKLVTPVFIFPWTYRSVWHANSAGLLIPYLSTADLLGWEDNVVFRQLITDLPFPFGYEVIPDDVPLT